MHRYRSDLGRFVVLIGTLLIGVIVAGALFFVSHGRDEHEAAAQRELANLARALTEQTTRALQSVDLAIRSVVKDVEAARPASAEGLAAAMGREAIHHSLRDRIAGLAQMDSLTIVGADGAIVATSRSWPPPAINVADRDYFKALCDDSSLAFYVSEPVRHRITGAWTVHLVRPLRGGGGAFVGIALGAVELRYFEEFYREITLGPGSSIALLRDDGLLLALHPWDDASIGRTLASDPRAASGAPTLRATESVKAFPLVVTVARAESAILAEWLHRTLIVIGAVALATLTIAALIAMLVRQIGRAAAAAAAVEASESRHAEKSRILELTLETMNQGIVLIDADRTVPVSNRRVCEILDLPAEVMAGRPRFDDILAHQRRIGDFGPDNAAAPEALHLYPQTGKTWTTPVYERRRPNGRVIEVRTLPLAGGGAVRTYTDITERRVAEQALREGEARLRVLADRQSALLDALPARVALIDADGVIVTANRAWHAHDSQACAGGWQADAGSNYLAACDAAAEDCAAAAGIARLVRQVLAGPSDVVSVEYARAHGDDKQWFRFMAAPIASDRRAGAVVMHLDITAAKRAEEAIVRAKAEAERAGQAKAEFLATMSHEIRTPLNEVIGLAGLLLDTALDETQRRHVTTLRASADHLLQLISDILDFSKLDAGRVELERAPFDLAEIVTGTAEMLRTRARAKGLTLSCMVDPAAPRCVIGDAARIRQILLNLGGNAVKFTERGEIAIAASVAAITDGQAVIRFVVRDTGIGIAPAAIGRLFQEFQQGDGSITRRYGGTGLGLSISRKLVRAMGGDIAVESAPGRGSVFSFALPLRRAPEGPATAREDARAEIASVSRRDGLPLRVLLAEDNRTNQLVAATILERAGCRVDIASNGLEAVAAVRERSYDVILMDVQMPEMDGLEAARSIRALPAPTGVTPIVALTANAFTRDRVACLEAGMSDFLAKPFSPPTLLKVLAKVLSGAAGSPPPALARATPPRGAAPALDAEMIGQQLDALGGREFHHIVAVFFAETESRLVRLKALDPLRDRPALLRELHSLKSASASVGLARLSARSRAAELAAQRGSDDVDGAIVEIADEFAAGRAALLGRLALESEPLRA